MTDPEREEILEVLSHKKHIPGQKCLILLLLLRPQGLTIYDFLKIMYAGKAYRNRRAIQRLLEYPLATGAIVKVPYEHKGSTGRPKPDVYKLGMKT